MEGYISPKFETAEDNESDKDETLIGINLDNNLIKKEPADEEEADYKENNPINTPQQDIKYEIKQEEFHCIPLKSEENIPPGEQNDTQLNNEEICSPLESTDNVPTGEKNNTAWKNEKEPGYYCKKCLYKTKSLTNLDRHSLLHLSPDKILWYKCSRCDYKTKYDFHLKSHEIIHKPKSEREMFSCEICSMEFIRKANLMRHLKKRHLVTKKEFECTNCSHITDSKASLSQHISTKHMRVSYKCSQCDRAFSSKVYLKAHVDMLHEKKKPLFKCPKCDFATYVQKHLRPHISYMHEKHKAAVHKCDQCDFSTVYVYNLRVHLKNQHRGSKDFTCGHCLKQFSRKNAMKRHIIVRHMIGCTDPVPPLQMQVSVKSPLKKHMNLIHTNK